MLLCITQRYKSISEQLSNSKQQEEGSGNKVSTLHDMNYGQVQLNKYETASIFFSNKPKLDIGLFVDLAEFPCFYAVLA